MISQSRITPTICVGSLWKLLEAGEQRGLSVASMTEGLSLDAALLERASHVPLLDRRVPLSVMAAVWATIMKRVGDPGLPIALSRTTRIEHFSLFGFLLKTSSSLRAALERTRRYSGIWTQGGTFDVLPTTHGFYVTYKHYDPAMPIGARCAAECVLADTVGLVRQLTGERARAFDVELEHAAPGSISAHRDFFRGDVQFSRPRTGVFIDAALFEVPLTARDDGMQSYFENQAETVLTSLGHHDDLASRVSRAIVDLLPNADASLDAVADRLAMGSRTLRRRLADAGTGFDTLLTTARRELADRYLRDPGVSIAEVALLLGFSEQASFQRAYRRWTGSTPGAFRNTVGGGPARASL